MEQYRVEHEVKSVLTGNWFVEIHHFTYQSEMDNYVKAISTPKGQTFIRNIHKFKSEWVEI